MRFAADILATCLPLDHGEGQDGWGWRAGGGHLLPGPLPRWTVAVPPLRPLCSLQRTTFSEGLTRDPRCQE